MSEGDRASPATSPRGPRRWAWVIVAVALACLHAALVRDYFGAALLDETPFRQGDFATHAAQVRRVLESWALAGRHWAYDVQLLAGAPNGVLFDADNKGWELWTWALVSLGVGEGKAFNGFVLAIHALMPVVVHASARLFRLDRAAALTVTGLAIALWGFDSFTRWMWFIGTVSYVFVAYFALLPLALFHRWMADRKPSFALGCALSLALAHLVHPYVFFILVGPMVAEYVRAGWIERSLTGTQHAISWAIAGLTVAVNSWWLVSSLRFVPYLLDSAYFAQSGIEFVFYDLFGLLRDADTQGWIGVRTAVRLVCVIAAVAALRAWRAAGDRRWLPFAVALATMAGFTYLGGYTPIAQIQPYRHALPLGFMALIPAGWWLTERVRARPWRGLQPGQGLLALLVLVLAGQHLLRDVLYFFAPSLPRGQALEDGREVPLGMLGYGPTPGYRYDTQPDWERLIAWVGEHDDEQLRWLVQDQVLGEYLMARTRAQVIGGFRVRNIEHSDANWLRRQGVEPPWDPADLRDYLETYAIRWVIVNRPEMSPWWDAQTELFSRAGLVDGMMIYRVKGPLRLIDGRGQVRASLNQIEVTGSDPAADLVLRFHWLETLECAPDCRIEREPVAGDRVGFMRIPAPHPADFTVANRYSFSD